MPDPYFPTCPVSSPRLISARTLSAALWCSVIPRVQQIIARSAFAYACATSRITSAGIPVTSAPRSSVQSITEAT